MSVDLSAAVTLIGRWQLDMRSLRILRYAVGSTIAMTIAMGFAWQLSFLVPVLSLSFFASPAPRPTLKQGTGFVATIAVACLAGLMLGKYLISYPLVFVPFMGFVLLRLFYEKASGRSPLLTMWLLIAMLVIPLITMTSPGISNMVASGILVSAATTVFVVWVTHGLLPDPAGSHARPAAAAAAPSGPAVLAPVERFRTAAISTLVVLPMFVLFYSFKLQSSLLILVFVALLSSQPGFASNFKAGGALVIGNAMGGVTAIIMYELLVMMPEFYFLIMLTLLGGLVFGALVFSDKPTAKLYGMAFSTLLLVIGSTTASGSDEAGSKVYTRVAQIVIAVVYVVMAFGVADRFVRRRETAK
jgi:hypothetical protein